MGKIKANWKNKGQKVIKTGYTTNKLYVTYCVYNPRTCKVEKCCDVQ